MTTIARITPALTVLLATLVTLVPWGLPGAPYYASPWITVMTVSYWSQRGGHVVPVWLVFLCGLVIDAFSGGPLGFFAFTLLAAHGIGAQCYQRLSLGIIGRWMMLLLTIVVLMLLQWLTAHLIVAGAPGLTELAPAALWAAAVSPAIIVLLSVCDALRGKKETGA